jgi:ubiquinone/menaquinone biosynthesis C-methylase UbiE
MRHIIGNKLWDLYSHIYDLLTRSYLENAVKEYTKEVLLLSVGEKAVDNLLIVGVGTGECLKYINQDIQITAIDYSSSMLKKASKKLKDYHNVSLVFMDAQKLDFDDKSFDRVLMPLIVAVVEDPYACLKEVDRVLKPGAKLVIFDKFINHNESPSFIRRIINSFTNLFATRIDLDIYKLIKGLNLRVVEERQVLFFGWLKIFVLEKA